jgi:hypothetical protein
MDLFPTNRECQDKPHHPFPISATMHQYPDKKNFNSIFLSIKQYREKEEK